MRGYGFDLVLPVQLNDIRIDSVLVRIMELAIRGGRLSRHKTNVNGLVEYISDLSKLESVIGFDSDEGKAVLEGWLRNSMVKMGASGRERTGSQMDYLRPLTVATFRSGLPKQVQYYRNVDRLVYRSMIEAVKVRRGLSDQSTAVSSLTELFTDTLGKGIDLGAPPHIQPQYDDAAAVPIDVNELLQLRFLEVFPKGADPAASRVKKEREEAVPEAFLPIGMDLLALYEKFGLSKSTEKWSAAELVSASTALISFRMFQLPLIIGEACEQALLGISKGEEYRSTAVGSLEIYCDLTQNPNGHSRKLAQECVRRDLEKMRQFFIDRVTLRTLAEISEMIDRTSEIMHEHPKVALRQVALIADEKEVDQICRLKFAEIKRQILETSENEAYEEYFVNLERQPISWLKKLVDIQVTALNFYAMQQQGKWFWATGGLISGGKNGSQNYALLRGNRHRPSWTYAPSDELLTVLLTMVFIDEDLDQPMSARLPLGEVLTRLYSRFGILISRPPKGMDTAENRKAASENLAAFVYRLKQLGCYRGLTDDLSAQFVERPRSRG